MGRRILRALTDIRFWVGVRVFIARALLGTAAGLALWAVLPIALGWNASAITSGSMMPAIRPGTVVAASPIGRGDAQPGQVVTVVNPARTDGSLLTHRIVRIDDEGRLVLRGDANDAVDSTRVDHDDVWLGRLAVPFVGMPQLWAVEGNWIALSAAGLGVVVLTLAAVDRPIPFRRARGAGRPAKTGRIAAEAAAGVLAFTLVVVPVQASSASFTVAAPPAAARWSTPDPVGIAPPEPGRPPLGQFGDAVMALDPFVFLRMDERAGSMLVDSSGNDRHAQVIGSVDLVEPGALPGALPGSTSASFDGQGGLVVDGTMATNEELTVVVLLRASQQETVTPIFEFVTPDGFRDRILLAYGSLIHQSSGGTTHLQMHIPPQQWTFIAVSLSGGNVLVNVNGTLRDQIQPIARGPVAHDARIVLGTQGQSYDDPSSLGANSLRGEIHEAVLFERALTPVEMQLMWIASGLDG